MNRIPLNSFLIVLLSQLIVVTILYFIPSELMKDFNLWLVLSLASVSTLVAFFFGLRGAFLFLAPAITIGGIFIVYFPSIIPSWFLLAGFLFLASLHLPAVWTHVPYYPTPEDIDSKILEFIPTKSEQNKTIYFADLGCGTARLLLSLARARPDVEFYGVELSFVPYLISKIRSFFVKNLTIEIKSFWKLDFSKFDVIYTFLSPAPMEQLGKKSCVELKPDAILVSNTFRIPNSCLGSLKESSIVVNDQLKGGTLYIYKR
jgi:hypothetical protein